MAGASHHGIWRGLFADDEVAALFSAERLARDMLRFEAALSRAVGQAGLADGRQAEAAAAAIEALTLDLDKLTAGTSRDGLPVPELVRQIKSALPESLHEPVHFGSTSQDVLDTCLALAVKDMGLTMAARIARIEDSLSKLKTTYGARHLMARTRMQAALPTAVSDRVGIWLAALQGAASALTDAVGALSVVQLGGPVGTRDAYGAAAAGVEADLAAILGLGVVERAWHADRRRVVAVGDALSHLSGALGKLGQDVVLMTQQGLDELRLAGGGTSSVMAHKANPIKAELLVTLARYNATQVSALHHALVHEQERSGAAWALEWLVLPDMAEATGRTLLAAEEVLMAVEDIGSPEMR